MQKSLSSMCMKESVLSEHDFTTVDVFGGVSCQDSLLITSPTTRLLLILPSCGQKDV